jgi:hypothetical protein
MGVESLSTCRSKMNSLRAAQTICHCERSEAIFPSRIADVSERQGKIASLHSQ